GLSSVIGIAFPCVKTRSWNLSARRLGSLGTLSQGDRGTKKHKRVALTFCAVTAEKWRFVGITTNGC
ncbi:MAG: hypothetical protein ACRD40_01125, partial [Candidatus Acidiferrales bacterium]